MALLGTGKWPESQPGRDGEDLRRHEESGVTCAPDETPEPDRQVGDLGWPVITSLSMPERWPDLPRGRGARRSVLGGRGQSEQQVS